MTITEIRQLLSENGIWLTKSLGQNFLHDKNQLRRIVEAAELTRRDKVIEIGPGLGQLTELLLARAGTVLAIEKDARLTRLLEQRFNVSVVVDPQNAASSCFGTANQSKEAIEPAAHQLTLIHGDALEFFSNKRCDWRRWKLVSNLPFSVASPILVELAQLENGPSRLVVTVQFEVAQRLLAVPSTPQYGLLSLLVGLSYTTCRMFKIPASCFFPQPKVDSACVVLQRREPPLLLRTDRTVFVELVKRAFSQRRKMMFKLLTKDWSEEKLAPTFKKVGLNRTIRAEQVSLEQFVQLTRMLSDTKNRMSSPREFFDVVNAADEVIDRKPRAVVHQLGLLHRAVHMLVFNSRGQVFLQKRARTKDRQPGLWDSSASGHVDAGEDYDTAAVRELAEELGIRIAKPPKRLFKLHACPETDNEFVWVYRCEHNGPIKPNPHEVESGDWFDSAVVTRWVADRPQDFASAFKLIWARIIAQK